VGGAKRLENRAFRQATTRKEKGWGRFFQGQTAAGRESPSDSQEGGKEQEVTTNCIAGLKRTKWKENKQEKGAACFLWYRGLRNWKKADLMDLGLKKDRESKDVGNLRYLLRQSGVEKSLERRTQRNNNPIHKKGGGSESLTTSKAPTPFHLKATGPEGGKKRGGEALCWRL